MSKKVKWPKLPKRDLLRAAQCCYYVLRNPFLADDDFDRLEKDYKKDGGALPIGSDNKLDYTAGEYALALYFAFNRCATIAGKKPHPMAADVPSRAMTKKDKQNQGLLDLG